MSHSSGLPPAGPNPPGGPGTVPASKAGPTVPPPSVRPVPAGIVGPGMSDGAGLPAISLGPNKNILPSPAPKEPSTLPVSAGATGTV